MNFTNIDDEYLIGITNKGIVKRSYKDMETLTITHIENDNTITLNLDDVTVTLTENLLDSSCTCPSRSICKHIIIGILHCKVTVSTDKVEEKQDIVSIDYIELFKTPTAKLLSIIGTRKQQYLISTIQHGTMPKINENSVITIELEEDIVVKLLTPLGYSLCSCKSKELCKHKALAILFYMVYKNKINLDDISIPKEAEFEYSNSKLFCSTIKQEITNALLVGLARVSDNIIEKTEKLAISCHNYKLATLEQKFREISNYYDMYFKHHVHFKEEVLLNKLANIYMLANTIEHVDSYDEFIKHAGVFREEYEILSRKTFIPIGERYMETLSGYAGFCYYFLEEDTKLVYSYSNVRPNFYDKSNRSSYGNEQVPWSFHCSVNELMIKKFVLENPKVSSDRRISSSSQTKGNIIENSPSTGKFPKGSVVSDFRTLIYIDELSENDKVAIVKISDVVFSEFDKIKQAFIMQVNDSNGFCMNIEIKYTKANDYIIKLLEKYCKKPSENTVFIGIVYLEDQKLKMLPIEYIREWEEY